MGHVARAVQGHVKQCLFETGGTCGHGAVGVEGKGMALKHQFILATHQMGVNQGQLRGARPLGHDRLAFIALAYVKGRGVDHSKHLRAGLLRQTCWLLKPSVFANQQAHAYACTFLARFEHAYPVARHKVAPLIKHLVIRQFALCVGGDHLAVAQHAGAVEALLHRHRSCTPTATLRVAHHHSHVV